MSTIEFVNSTEFTANTGFDALGRFVDFRREVLAIKNLSIGTPALTSTLAHTIKNRLGHDTNQQTGLPSNNGRSLSGSENRIKYLSGALSVSLGYPGMNCLNRCRNACDNQSCIHLITSNSVNPSRDGYLRTLQGMRVQPAHRLIHHFAILREQQEQVMRFFSRNRSSRRVSGVVSSFAD